MSLAAWNEDASPTALLNRYCVESEIFLEQRLEV